MKYLFHKFSVFLTGILIFVIAQCQAQTIQVTYAVIGSDTLHSWFSDTCIVMEKFSMPSMRYVDKIDFKKKEVIVQINQYNDFTRNTHNSIFTFKELKKKKPFMPMLVKLTDETKVILGFECHKALVEKGQTHYDIWYTKLPQLPDLNYNFYSIYYQIPGVIIEEWMNGNLIMHAVSVVEGKWCNYEWVDYQGF